jgi:hypothetical protein
MSVERLEGLRAALAELVDWESAGPTAAREDTDQFRAGYQSAARDAIDNVRTLVDDADPAIEPEVIVSRRDGPMHLFFELSYASYLVLPRALIQEMPLEWQRRMVSLLDQMRAEFPGYGTAAAPDNYRVHLLDEGTHRFRRDGLSEYRHPDHALIDSLRKAV